MSQQRNTTSRSQRSRNGVGGRKSLVSSTRRTNGQHVLEQPIDTLCKKLNDCSTFNSTDSNASHINDRVKRIVAESEESDGVEFLRLSHIYVRSFFLALQDEVIKQKKVDQLFGGADLKELFKVDKEQISTDLKSDDFKDQNRYDPAWKKELGNLLNVIQCIAANFHFAKQDDSKHYYRVWLVRFKSFLDWQLKGLSTQIQHLSVDNEGEDRKNALTRLNKYQTYFNAVYKGLIDNEHDVSVISVYSDDFGVTLEGNPLVGVGEQEKSENNNPTEQLKRMLTALERTLLDKIHAAVAIPFEAFLADTHDEEDFQDRLEYKVRMLLDEALSFEMKRLLIDVSEVMDRTGFFKPWVIRHLNSRCVGYLSRQDSLQPEHYQHAFSEALAVLEQAKTYNYKGNEAWLGGWVEVRYKTLETLQTERLNFECIQILINAKSHQFLGAHGADPIGRFILFAQLSGNAIAASVLGPKEGLVHKLFLMLSVSPEHQVKKIKDLSVALDTLYYMSLLWVSYQIHDSKFNGLSNIKKIRQFVGRSEQIKLKYPTKQAVLSLKNKHELSWTLHRAVYLLDQNVLTLKSASSDLKEFHKSAVALSDNAIKIELGVLKNEVLYEVAQKSFLGQVDLRGILHFALRTKNMYHAKGNVIRVYDDILKALSESNVYHNRHYVRMIVLMLKMSFMAHDPARNSHAGIWPFRFTPTGVDALRRQGAPDDIVNWLLSYPDGGLDLEKPIHFSSNPSEEQRDAKSKLKLNVTRAEIQARFEKMVYEIHRRPQDDKQKRRRQETRDFYNSIKKDVSGLAGVQYDQYLDENKISLRLNKVIDNDGQSPNTMLKVLLACAQGVRFYTNAEKGAEYYKRAFLKLMESKHVVELTAKIHVVNLVQVRKIAFLMWLIAEKDKLDPQLRERVTGILGEGMAFIQDLSDKIKGQKQKYKNVQTIQINAEEFISEIEDKYDAVAKLLKSEKVDAKRVVGQGKQRKPKKDSRSSLLSKFMNASEKIDSVYKPITSNAVNLKSGSGLKSKSNIKTHDAPSKKSVQVNANTEVNENKDIMSDQDVGGEQSNKEKFVSLDGSSDNTQVTTYTAITTKLGPASSDDLPDSSKLKSDGKTTQTTENLVDGFDKHFDGISKAYENNQFSLISQHLQAMHNKMYHFDFDYQVKKIDLYLNTLLDKLYDDTDDAQKFVIIELLYYKIALALHALPEKTLPKPLKKFKKEFVHSTKEEAVANSVAEVCKAMSQIQNSESPLQSIVSQFELFKTNAQRKNVSSPTSLEF